MLGRQFEVLSLARQVQVRLNQDRYEEAQALFRQVMRIQGDMDSREFLTQIERRVDPAVVPIEDAAVKPQPVRRPAPVLSDALRHRAAVMEVAFIVDRDGRVRDAYIALSIDETFDDVVLKAVKRWVFEPGPRGGEAAPVRMWMPLKFRAQVDGSTASQLPN